MGNIIKENDLTSVSGTQEIESIAVIGVRELERKELRLYFRQISTAILQNRREVIIGFRRIKSIEREFCVISEVRKFLESVIYIEIVYVTINPWI